MTTIRITVHRKSRSSVLGVLNSPVAFSHFFHVEITATKQKMRKIKVLRHDCTNFENCFSFSFFLKTLAFSTQCCLCLAKRLTSQLLVLLFREKPLLNPITIFGHRVSRSKEDALQYTIGVLLDFYSEYVMHKVQR